MNTEPKYLRTFRKIVSATIYEQYPETIEVSVQKNINPEERDELHQIQNDLHLIENSTHGEVEIWEPSGNIRVIHLAKNSGTVEEQIEYCDKLLEEYYNNCPVVGNFTITNEKFATLVADSAIELEA